MLHLVGNTSSAWLDNAVAHLGAVLVDHAHCEHKAAVTALSLVSKYPDDPRLVTSMGELARDEAGHFARVAKLCIGRGLELGHPEKDHYVVGLLKATTTANVLDARVDRLLACALIEGRSCERLQLLARALPNHRDAAFVDDDICALYDDLWREEATHHLLFIELAERSLDRAGVKNAAAQVAARLGVLADVEGRLVRELPIRAAIH